MVVECKAHDFLTIWLALPAIYTDDGKIEGRRAFSFLIGGGMRNAGSFGLNSYDISLFFSFRLYTLASLNSIDLTIAKIGKPFEPAV